MNKLWVIARKDIREAFRSRSTYIYIAVLVLLTFTYVSNYNSVINSLAGQNSASQTVSDVSRAFLNSLAYTLPMMYSVLVCTIFSAYSVIVDKARRNMESLMATPLSLRQIWMGKTLAVTVPSLIIGLGVSTLGYLILNFITVMPKTGFFVTPEPLAIVSALIIVPVLIFSVVTVVIYLQLVIANPRIANFVFTAIFLILFFGTQFLAGAGIRVNFSVIYLGIIVICSLGSYLLSRSFTKERVVLSSKG